MDSKLNVYIITGCCGSGKTTLAKEFANNSPKTALISGDDVRDFYIDKCINWDEKYKLTWQNILLLVNNFLNNGINVMVEYIYVFENELSNALSISNKYDAEMKYVVMTANEAVIEERLISRGDANLVKKALSFQKKLCENDSNKHYLYDGTNIPFEKQIYDITNWKLYTV